MWMGRVGTFVELVPGLKPGWGTDVFVPGQGAGGGQQLESVNLTTVTSRASKALLLGIPHQIAEVLPAD